VFVEVLLFTNLDPRIYSYEKGASTRIPMQWDDRRRILTIGDRKGLYPGMLTTRHLVVALPDGSTKRVTYTGKKVTVRCKGPHKESN
jgi:alpha-D-xyloside xylohydrolase